MSLRGGFEQQDGCLLFSFTGQLDAYSEKQFLAFISEHLTSTPQPLVIDLSKIDFIDSSGLGALVQIAGLGQFHAVLVRDRLPHRIAAGQRCRGIPRRGGEGDRRRRAR